METKKQPSSPATKGSITIQGTTYDFRVNMGTLLRVKRATGKEPDKLGNSIEETMSFVFALLQSNAKCYPNPLPWGSFEDFCDDVTPDDLSTLKMV